MKRTLPILAGAGLIVAAALIVPRLVQDAPAPKPKLIRLEWDRDEIDDDTNVIVVLEQSSNMVNWTELVRTRTSIVLTADQPRMFYRAYRAWDESPQQP